ncbi:hypothetical protein [Reichenbachiella sp.]
MKKSKLYQAKTGFLSTIDLEEVGKKMATKINKEFDLLEKSKNKKPDA